MAKIIQIEDLVDYPELIGGILEGNANSNFLHTRQRILCVERAEHGGIWISTGACVTESKNKTQLRRYYSLENKRGFLAPGSVMVTDFGHIVYAANDGNGILIFWPKGKLTIPELPSESSGKTRG
jgi:hypothetical protein